MSTSDRQPGALAVRLLEPAASEDAALVGHLTRLINDVYAVAEGGLWRDGTTRTTPSEIVGLIRAEEIAIATGDSEIAGCVRLHDVADDASEFGMLVSAPKRRSTGVGRALVAFAEERSRERGRRRRIPAPRTAAGDAVRGRGLREALPGMSRESPAAGEACSSARQRRSVGCSRPEWSPTCRKATSPTSSSSGATTSASPT